MKMKRNLESIQQRDPMLAIQNAAIIGIPIFLVIYAFFIAALAYHFKSDFQGNFKLTAMSILAYNYQMPFLIKDYNYESIINYLSQYNFFIKSVNFGGLLISGCISFYLSSSEYKNLMANERHIEGARFFDNVVEAKNAFTAEMQKAIKEYSITRKIDAKIASGFKIGDVAISRDQETKHIVIMGKTGGGKTVALWPIILYCIARGEKVIIHCNKGDFTAKLLDFFGLMPILSAPWDARGWAWDVAKDVATEADAAELAAKMIKESGGDPMWSEGARQILTGLIKHLQKHYKENWTFRDLADLLAKPTEELSQIVTAAHPEALRVVELTPDEQGNMVASKTVQSLMITMSAQMSSVFRLAMAYEKVENRFSMRDFLDDKLPSNVLILQSNERYRTLAEAINQSLISCLNLYVNSATYEERPPHAKGVRLILDEFPQLGKVQSIYPLLEVGRSKNVGVILASQDAAQYEVIYGKAAADTLLAIPQTFIYCTLGSNAAKFASDSAGQCTVERYSYSIQNDGKRSENWQRSVEPVAKPDAFYNDLGLKEGGTNAVVQLSGGDVYKLFFPFTVVKGQRPGVVPANWTTPEFLKNETQKAEEEFNSDNRLLEVKKAMLAMLQDDEAVAKIEELEIKAREELEISIKENIEDDEQSSVVIDLSKSTDDLDDFDDFMPPM